MAQLFQNADVVDAMIVAAMLIIGGLILAACVAALYRRFAAMSGRSHPRRRG
jgi:hypothetical protein